MLGKKSYQNIAVLIDADHNETEAVDKILNGLEKRGNVAVKIAFGDWRKLDWEALVRTHSIKTEQYFPLTEVKNAADIGLAITAVRLLDRGIYDAFALIASDSDYTPLVMELRSAGVDVLGFVKEIAPKGHTSLRALRSAFTEYTVIESKKRRDKAEKQEEAGPAPVKEKPKKERAPKEKKPAPVKEKAPAEKKPLASPAGEPSSDELKDQVHRILRDGYVRGKKDEEGFVNIQFVGQRVNRIPDFKYSAVGCKNLSDFIKKYPEKYEFKEGMGFTRLYKCKA